MIADRHGRDEAPCTAEFNTKEEIVNRHHRTGDEPARGCSSRRPSQSGHPLPAREVLLRPDDRANASIAAAHSAFRWFDRPVIIRLPAGVRAVSGSSSNASMPACSARRPGVEGSPTRKQCCRARSASPSCIRCSPTSSTARDPCAHSEEDDPPGCSDFPNVAKPCHSKPTADEHAIRTLVPPIRRCPRPAADP